MLFYKVLALGILGTRHLGKYVHNFSEEENRKDGQPSPLISSVERLIVLKGEFDIFCTCFSYKSATVSVLSIIRQGYVMNGEHEISDLISSGVTMRWFSSFSFCAVPRGLLYTGLRICLRPLSRCGRGQFGALSQSASLKTIQSISCVLGNFI